MKIKENKKLKDRNNNKIKRQVSIITVFLWIFLVATMITVVTQNIKNTNALEHDNVSIYTDINDNINIFEDQIKQEIAKPNKPTVNDLPSKNQKGYVYVKCIDNAKHVGYIGIRDSSNGWKFGEVMENDGRFESDISAEDYPWMCELILDKEFYKELFNKNFLNTYGKHYIEESNNIISVWFLSDGEEWYFFTQDFPMTVWITHEEVEYTVIYTDGVDGEIIFQNQTYKNLKAGDPTPTFVGGTPTREGYEFLGWSPEVKEIVYPNDSNSNGIITYTAMWKKIAPDRTDLHGILRNFVKVHCVNNKHEDKLYSTWTGNLDGIYEASIGEVYYSEEKNKHLCDVTLNGEVYSSMYKSEPSFGVGIIHHLVRDNNINEPAILDEDKKKVITLYYDEKEKKWKKSDDIELPIVFNVRCGICPETLTRDILPRIIGNTFVNIHCVSNTNHYNKDKYYGLVDNTTIDGEHEVTIGDIYYSEEKNVYLCNVDINGSIYTEKYSSEMGVHHELDAPEMPYKEITLYYDKYEKRWKILDKEQLPIIFNVGCNYVEVEGFYKVKHEYYLKDKSNNMILEGTLNSKEVKIVYGLGERIEVGLSSGFNKVDIEVEKVPTCTINNVNYTYEYLENSGNVIIEENTLKEITLKYVRNESNELRIKAEKIWEDENNKYSKRPENVILQLKNGEKIVAEMQASEENKWSCEFVVPKYDKDGNEIEYTVDEKETSEFYEKVIDGYKVINKYKNISEDKDENNNKENGVVDTSDINIFMYILIFFGAIILIISVIIILKRKI